MNNIQNLYTSVVSTGRYDLTVATAINSELFVANLTPAEFLSRNKKIIDSCHLGDSINFSLYFMLKLKEYGLHSTMISTPEDDVQKVSVSYEKDGMWFVSDIIEDIKFLTNIENKHAEKHGFPATYQKGLRQDFIDHFSDHYAIPLDDFKKINEYVKMYADIFWFEGKMSDFLKSGHLI